MRFFVSREPASAPSAGTLAGDELLVVAALSGMRWGVWRELLHADTPRIRAAFYSRRGGCVLPLKRPVVAYPWPSSTRNPASPDFSVLKKSSLVQSLEILPAFSMKIDAVGHLLGGEAHFVRDAHQPVMPSLASSTITSSTSPNHFGVQRRGGLVEQLMPVGSMREGAGDGDALLLTAGELRRELVACAR